MKLVCNSKKIKKGDTFIAISDEILDRNSFISDAIKKKAFLIITDKEKKYEGNFVLKVNDCNNTLFQLYNDYYGNPFNNISLIGVTGTDGKTTCSSIIRDLLENFYKCGLLGTNGFYYDKHIKTNNTTPSIIDILKFGNILKKNGYKYLVMEASSEGLLHNRCKNLLFKCAIMTNVTCDHLNVHQDYNNYLNSKLKLFNSLDKDGVAILNADDNNYNFFKKNINNKVITYGMQKKCDLYFYNINEYSNETTFNLKYNKHIYKIHSPLIGNFNVYNLVASIGACLSFNIKIDDILKNISKIRLVKGRMNYINFNQNFDIILDYAHTENATYQVLKFFNKIKKKRIITVAGCAGGRYKGKRSKIGKIISDMSDVAIFTKDDPRFENVNNIIDEMTENIQRDNVTIISNRAKAIRHALNIAKKDDIILILGKGLDDYMAVKNKYKKYNDYKVIKRYFTKVF